MNLTRLLPLLWFALAAAAVAVVALPILRRRRREKLLAEIRAGWGRLRVRDRDLTAIAAYYRHRAAVDGPDRSLDDRTWADLNMDDLFADLDRTESVVGGQVLYARLRSAPLGAHLDAFEALVTRVTTDIPLRERAQVGLARLRDPSGYDIWRLTEPGVMQTQPWHAVVPFLAVAMFGAVLALPFWPPALLMLVAGSIVSLSIRTTVARQLLVVSGAFRQLDGLAGAASACAGLSGADTAALLGTMATDVARMSRLRRIASWVSRDASSAVSGQLGGLVLEYLNLLFCLDANALFFGARELAARGPELLRVVNAVGEVDAAISVASYRAGVTGWTRPQFTDSGSASIMKAIRHPLLPDAVPNTIAIDARRGAIITGSNMSGKTTFLRTVGISAVLAQTINTCLADEYRSPAFVVRTCIGRADDPASGKSYYLVEVESVLALVNWSRTTTPHLFLFDELFRGTNAVERIAAGEAVLHALVTSGPQGRPCPHAVLAATHDQELVDLLRDTYAAYHFTDTIDEQGLSFDFRLQPGAATTRNAILLLRLRGAPDDLVEHALARAAELDQARQRSAT
jgi:hypothetical protein